VGHRHQTGRWPRTKRPEVRLVPGCAGPPGGCGRPARVRVRGSGAGLSAGRGRANALRFGGAGRPTPLFESAMKAPPRPATSAAPPAPPARPAPGHPGKRPAEPVGKTPAVILTIGRFDVGGTKSRGRRVVDRRRPHRPESSKRSTPAASPAQTAQVIAEIVTELAFPSTRCERGSGSGAGRLHRREPGPRWLFAPNPGLAQRSRCGSRSRTGSGCR